MGLRESVLNRILSLDARRSAELSLRFAQDHVEAGSAALLAVESSRGVCRYVLFSATELDQDDLKRIAAAWAGSRDGLLSGRRLIEADWALVPVGRPVSGLLYLADARRPVTPGVADHLLDELGSFFEGSIQAREEEPEARRLFRMILERKPLKEIAREKLLLLLRATDWNKTRVAEILGVTRATLYKWLRKHDITDDQAA